MSDKNSRKTEDEMLDQTFGQYTDESTQTSDADAKAADVKAPKKSLLNNNYVIIGGCALLMVVFVGYKLLTTPQPQQQSKPNPTPVVQQVVEQTPVQPTQPVVESQQVNSSVSQFMNNNDVNSNNIEVKVGASQPEVKAPAPVEVKMPTPIQTSTPVEVKTPTPIQTSTPVQIQKPVEVKLGNEGASVNKVDVNKMPNVSSYNNDVKSQNANLIEQFEKMLSNKYDPKFEKIENSLNKQESFNRSIEERLSRLESGKQTKVIKETNIVKETNTNALPVKVVKHVKPQNSIVKTAVETQKVDNEVILDKRVNTNKVQTLVNSPKVEQEIHYPAISVHSIFSGRLWTKNSDGSLSTYTVGDKLPTGEIIKKIDDTNYEVTTDKRKF